MKKILFLIIMISLLGFMNVWSETSGKLQGFVYGDDGKIPLENAQVFIRGTVTNVIYQSMLTKKNGAYEIEKIEPDTYIVGIKYNDKEYNLDVLLMIQAKKQLACFTLPKVLEQPGYIVRCSSPKCFFVTPCGWALVAGVSAGITYGIIKIREEQVSPTGI
jgi:hypothetical protein